MNNVHINLMTGHDRRTREQATIRTAILDAALKIAAAEGWTAVTMRRIAERIEFSPGTLYGYFPAKRDLLMVLARLGFATLGDRLGQIQETAPERRLRAMAALAWDFAFTSRPLYELMQSGEVFEFGTAATPPEARAVFMHLREAVAGVVGAARPDLDDLTDLLWASISGLIALTQLGRVADGAPRARHLLDRLISDLIGAWCGG